MTWHEHPDTDEPDTRRMTWSRGRVMTRDEAEELDEAAADAAREEEHCNG